MKTEGRPGSMGVGHKVAAARAETLKNKRGVSSDIALVTPPPYASCARVAQDWTIRQGLQEWREPYGGWSFSFLTQPT